MQGDWLVNLKDARTVLACEKGIDRAAFVMRRGSMKLGLYVPKRTDRQAPHTQDEIYIVLDGTAIVVVGGEQRPCTPGDVIFVAAAIEHRFEAFSPEFEVCVIFWGPDGGERMACSEESVPLGAPVSRSEDRP